MESSSTGFDWAIDEARNVLALSQTDGNRDAFYRIVEACVHALSNDGCIFFVGNGGSAADAQHLAAELVGRTRADRRPLRGIALTTDSSILTALVNDYGAETMFSRQLAATARSGDVLFAISTSGESRNVLCAAELAREMGVFVAALTGRGGSSLETLAEAALLVASGDTALIQTGHILLGQAILLRVETELARSLEA